MDGTRQEDPSKESTTENTASTGAGGGPTGRRIGPGRCGWGLSCRRCGSNFCPGGGKGYNFYTSKGGKPLFRGGMPPLTPHVLHLCFLTNPQRAFLCQSQRGSKLRRLKRLRAGGGPLPRLSLLRAQADQWNSWIKGVVSEAGTRHLAARLDPM